MFQYAFGRSVASILGWPLKLDLSFYSNQPARWAQRSFALENFKIKVQIASVSELEPFKKYLGQDFLSKTLRVLSSKFPNSAKGYFYEPRGENFIFNEKLLKIKPSHSVYFDGFWQTPKYFSGIESIIRKEFEFSQTPDGENQAIIEKISGSNSVAVHIRHGDNATKMAAHHGVLPISYYLESAELLAKRNSQLHFFVFSDDVKWAEENLTWNYPTTFISHNGEERHQEDLRLMTYCKHHIIGNSTFSWWGSWLGKKPGQEVCAPSRYHMKRAKSSSDYYPPEWNIVRI